MDAQENEGYELPVTYREVTEMPLNVGYENIIEQPPKQPVNLKIDNDGFVQGTSVGERNIETLDIENEENNDIDRSRSGQYDYIDDRFVTVDVYDDTRNNDNHNTSTLPRNKCSVKHVKCKIIAAVAITAVITTIVVATVTVLVVAPGEGKACVSGDGSYQTTPETRGRQRTPDLSESELVHTTDQSDSELRQTTDQSESELGRTTHQSESEPASLVIIGGVIRKGTYIFIYYDTVQIYTVDKGHVTWNKY